MRFAPGVVVALAACGTDGRTIPDGSAAGADAIEPIDGAPSGDATEVPPDGIPPNLTPCEEAVFHADLAWIQAQIFDVSCTTRCHGDSPPAAELSLLPGESRAALVGVASTEFAGWLRVAPGDPGASMLMVQIGGVPGPDLEAYMPLGQPMLCIEKIDAIRRWIAAGAQP